MSEPDAQASTTAPTWWQLAGATVLSLGVVSSVSQFAARQLFAPDVPLAPGETGWSTGGLIALLGAIYVATRCQSWTDFKQRIGLVAALTAAAAFAATYFITESRTEQSTRQTEQAAPSPAPSRAEVAAAVSDAVDNLDKAEWLDVFKDAKASGQSIDHIRSTLADDFESGGMPAAQYCVLDYWVTEVQYINVNYDDVTILEYCTKEIRESYRTGELHDASTA